MTINMMQMCAHAAKAFLSIKEDGFCDMYSQEALSVLGSSMTHM